MTPTVQALSGGKIWSLPILGPKSDSGLFLQGFFMEITGFLYSFILFFYTYSSKRQ